MKQHFLGLAVATLTFFVSWSIHTQILSPAIGGIVLDAPVTGLEVSPAWSILVSWQHRDLRQIDGAPKAQLQMAIESLRGKPQNPFLSPRLFSRVLTSDGDHKYVLIEESPLVMIPGGSGLGISLFTTDGKLIDSSEFEAGWRIALTEIRLVSVNDIRGEVLEVDALPFINGANIAKQYYALVGNKMKLIRLEDSKGALFTNYYGAPNHTIGFVQTGRSPDDWQEALVSNDVAEVLATLTWLGGEHLNPREAEPNYMHEDLSEARVVEEVRARPAVKAAVNALKHSQNRWIREAATATAKLL
jgi:hypothetical protein